MGISGSYLCKKDSNKHLVVIGGSYAGRSVIHLLNNYKNVTWIDRRGCMIHKMLIRGCVSDDWVEPMLVPNDKMSAVVNRVHANVSLVDTVAKKVHYNDGSKDCVVDYDYLVIASGATSFSPAEPVWTSIESSTKQGLTSYLKANVGIVEKHSNIMVVGGGPVGCEMAAEIKAKYPSKNVALANRSGILCSNMRNDQAGSDKIKKGLEDFGVRVYLNKSVELPDSEKGQKFVEFDTPRDLVTDETNKFDLVINCSGAAPNTSFMAKEFLTDSGHIKVNSYLQVEGQTNVFAIGDCNNVDEPKLFATAGTKKFMFGLPTGQADILAANICAIENGKPDRLTVYKPAPSGGKPTIMLPLGSKSGVAVNVPMFFVKMKAKNYFYPAHWKFGKSSPPTQPKC